jgi:NSS family neurotransmitter:Na+ symporter
MNEKSESWSGQLGFILATVGSAVGIGSIWKFPYEVGANGGSAFLLFYVLGLILIVIPLMLAEFAIGRRGRGDPLTSIRTVAAYSGISTYWSYAGLLGVATGFLILSFYSVIGGFTIGYAFETIVRGLPGQDPAAVDAAYRDFIASPQRLLAYHLVFMTATGLVVARGVAGGIETAAKILMPVLAVLMLALTGYATVEGNLVAALRFLFQLDLKSFQPGSALEALGLGFFSIGVGMGLMITYAAYGPSEIDLKRVAVISVLADTAVSFLAGLTVFPIVFAHGLDPASGPGLVFVTLPVAFAKMPLGSAAAAAFFLLLFVAALASAISMLELVVALLIRRLTWSRGRATLVAAAVCLTAGIATVFSFNLWASWHPLHGFRPFYSATIFDLLDFLTSNLLLPMGGLAMALFAGWALPKKLLAEELRLTPKAATALRVMLRYVAPAGIVAATWWSLAYVS